MVLRISPSQQQRNMSDCGLFAIANCISLAYGYDPASICYTGDLREEFISMLSAGELKMFSYKPRSESIKTDVLPMNEIYHSYDAICHCGYPETWGNCVECDNCMMTFHQQCYLVNDQSQIMKRSPTFQCYKCRAEGNYDFMGDTAQKVKVDRKKIEEVTRIISKMDKHKLRNFLVDVLHQSQNPNTLFFNMKDYKRFQTICVQYDLNSVGLGVGDLYHAISEYYHRSIVECRDYYPWEFLSQSHHVHLAVLMICQATNVDLPPLWKRSSDVVVNLGTVNLSSLSQHY
jgi:hypothetical protein